MIDGNTCIPCDFSISQICHFHLLFTSEYVRRTIPSVSYKLTKLDELPITLPKWSRPVLEGLQLEISVSWSPLSTVEGVLMTTLEVSNLSSP